MIEACDSARLSGRVNDDSWQRLADHYSEQNLLDIVFTIGQYALIAICLKSLDVQLDEGLSLPDWDAA